MNPQNDITQRLYVALPAIKQWIVELQEDHAEQARFVSSLGFTALSECFPRDLLGRTKVIMVPRVQFPPVDQFGLPELKSLQEAKFAGITFGDTIFLQDDQTSEAIHFHELVHVVQWATLGINKFLLAYGIGLLQSGYDQSPLEQMAYALQDSFEEGERRQNLVGFIELQTDEIWRRVEVCGKDAMT